MGSTWIKQDSSINKANRECTYHNGIRCMRILLDESENSSLTSTSLLAGRSLAKTSHKTSATTLLSHNLRSTRVLSWRQLVRC